MICPPHAIDPLLTRLRTLPQARLFRRALAVSWFAAVTVTVGLANSPSAPTPVLPHGNGIATTAPLPDGMARRVATSENGMVVSSDPIASEVGIQILRDGGNAVDAAVAVAFALAVVYPQAGNLGGGGFFLYRDGATGEPWVVDYRETAPAAATPTMFLGPDGEADPARSREGYLSVAVPGSPAGLALAHQRYGDLPWKQLVAPAIALARKGFPVSEYLANEIRIEAATLRNYPASAALFLPGGQPPKPGTRLRQRDLARTLEAIAKSGPAGFYSGPVAEAIAKDSAEHGGILTAADLAAYRPRIRRPIQGTYGPLKILMPPPPSSGGVIALEILNMLEPYSLARYGARSTKSVHLMAEVERRAFADRSAHLGDPDFFNVPLSDLISKQYASTRAIDIRFDRATPSRDVKPGDPHSAPTSLRGPAPAPAGMREGNQTTHFAVVDRWRNIAAVTTTLNWSFGSRVVARGTGVLLNNEMDDFSAKPGAPNLYGLVGGEANAIRPGKRPLSSMAPTIVLKNNQPYLVLGTPGGATIITSIVQVLLDVVEYGQSLPEAVKTPRFHHQWLPDTIAIEDGALSPEVQQALRAMGHTITVREPIGDMQAIRIDPARGTLEGVSDPRGPGEPRGY